MAHGQKGVPPIPAGYVVGAKAVLRAARSAQPVERVIVAADAPAETVAPVRAFAVARALVLVEVPSSADLGRACGLRRPVAAAAQLRIA